MKIKFNICIGIRRCTGVIIKRVEATNKFSLIKMSVWNTWELSFVIALTAFWRHFMTINYTEYWFFIIKKKKNLLKNFRLFFHFLFLFLCYFDNQQLPIMQCTLHNWKCWSDIVPIIDLFLSLSLGSNHTLILQDQFYFAYYWPPEPSNRVL